MIIKNERTDVYISKSRDFAKPVLNHFRDLVHKACPEVEEKIKWSFPHFDYRGEMMCSMAAFKEHCAFGFWKFSLLKTAPVKRGTEDKDGMGSFGKIKSVKELPADKTLLAMILEAMTLNEKGIKLPSKPKTSEKKELIVPGYFTDILKKNHQALLTFQNFPYSHKKEYLLWFEEAKSEETRNKRMATAVEWITEGKRRNWKYERNK